MKHNKQEEQFLILPYSILKNKELKDGDKITLSLIYSFHNNDKEIYISNNKLGDMLGISRTAASERITKLETLGYIKCERIMVNGKERRTIVPLRMVGRPNVLVGEPNLLVGEPNGISRSTDTSLVGEVGSIIYPLLDNELNKLPHNELNKEISVDDRLKQKHILEQKLKTIFKSIHNIDKVIKTNDWDVLERKDKYNFNLHYSTITEYQSIKI